MRLEQDVWSDQAARWNGVGGAAWIEEQEMVDRLFKPIEDRLAQEVDEAGARHVLDVGCGTGTTTLAAARRLETGGECIGIDISQPMIAVAQARAERDGAAARFVPADAQTYAFEPASFDMIVSRFGVMFFDDPLAAFANLRSATRKTGRLRVFTWRGAEENPFMTTAERAAASLLADLPARRPDGPGQFALADPNHIQRILGESGWSGIDIRPFDFEGVLPEAQLVRYFTRFGPLGLVLGHADERTRSRIIEAVRPAFDPYMHGNQARFTAACWMVSARVEA